MYMFGDTNRLTRSVTAPRTLTAAVTASNRMANGAAASASAKNSVTTTRSVTVTKKTTVYKKRSWSDLITGKGDVSVNTLEMCHEHGYNVEGLYVVPEFVRLLDSLNKRQREMAAEIQYPRDYGLSIRTGDEFDVVVIGCGAAGSVLASRLSDVKDLNVLVLEAGTAPSAQSEVPALWANSVGTEMDWNYRAKEDETFGQSLDGKTVRVVRGKCLGGTTAINTMLYDRGLESDYLKLEKAGLTGWSFEDVLKYYKRSEDCRFEKITKHHAVSGYHGRGGKLCVDSFRNKKTVQIKRAYANALKALDCDAVDFFDVKNHEGFVTAVAMVENGLRVNAAKAFLRNANKKYNLKISGKSLAKRVIFEGKRAVGVEFENAVGETVRVKCRKQVVLSAGPVESPKLLLRSGVGPAKLLDSLFVPAVVKNDRVGANLRAHPVFMGLVFKFETEPLRSYSISEMVFEYLTKRTGPLATIGLCSFTGFVDVDGNGVPDVQISNHYYSPDDSVIMPSQLDAFNFDDGIAEQIIDLNDEHGIQIVGISLLRPKNAGRVTIANTDQEDCEPVIEYGSLDESDVRTLVKAVGWMRRLMGSESFKRYGPSVVPLKIGGEGPEPNAESDEYWRHAVKHLTTMNVQMAGTCSMAADVSKGVVDENFSVFGAESLMVADSSALPILISAESCASSIMVAEKASDILLEKLGCKAAGSNEESDEE